jgi:hypothetical protein
MTLMQYVIIIYCVIVLIVGHDVHIVDVDLDVSENTYDLSGLIFRPLTRYFTNIVAYTHAGIHRTMTSDGFQMVVDPPLSGVVFDGPGN